MRRYWCPKLKNWARSYELIIWPTTEQRLENLDGIAGVFKVELRAPDCQNAPTHSGPHLELRRVIVLVCAGRHQ